MSLSSGSLPLAAPAPARGSARLPESLRYGLVSLAALAVDAGGLAFLVELAQMPLLAANALSFMAGSVVAYLGSILWVFRHRRVESWPQELTIFVSIGIAGLLVNQAGLWVFTEAAGFHYGPAKAGAAAASFAFNYGLRKVVLFRG